jgi:hypothetical protein
MRVAPCVLVAVLAATAVAGCADPYYRGTRYGYTPQPQYAYVYTAQPQYAYAYTSDTTYGTPYYGSSYGYASKWDYYRNYQGNVKPGPERYP